MITQQFSRRVGGRVRQAGFSLLESVATLGIAGVLASVAVPGFQQFRDQAAIDTRWRTLGAALQRARSEAMTRGETITVCALDPASAEAGAPDCRAAGKDWSAGWIVFVDRGDRGELGDGDRVIAVEQAPAQTGPVVATQRYLTYRASGELLSIAAHFRFQRPGQPAVDEALPGSALVCVNKPGKARLATGGRCSS